MALAASEYYKTYIDSANSTQPTTVWSSTAVSGNYSYTEFIDQLLFDRLGRQEDEIKYYIDKLADKVDEDLLKAIKSPEVKSCVEFMKSAQTFDPKNLWSEPLCLNLNDAQSVAQK